MDTPILDRADRAHQGSELMKPLHVAMAVLAGARPRWGVLIVAGVGLTARRGRTSAAEPVAVIVILSVPRSIEGDAKDLLRLQGLPLRRRCQRGNDLGGDDEQVGAH
jgi:hypothetical protein